MVCKHIRSQKIEAASNVDEDAGKCGGSPRKNKSNIFDRFTKLGADALKKQMLTQYILERKTSKREMPRTHTAAAFFHCSRWVRLQVCRRGFPLLAEFPASCLRGLLHAGLPPAPAPCAAFAAAPSWLSFLQRCRFSFFLFWTAEIPAA